MHHHPATCQDHLSRPANTKLPLMMFAHGMSPPCLPHTARVGEDKGIRQTDESFASSSRTSRARTTGRIDDQSIENRRARTTSQNALKSSGKDLQGSPLVRSTKGPVQATATPRPRPAIATQSIDNRRPSLRLKEFAGSPYCSKSPRRPIAGYVSQTSQICKYSLREIIGVTDRPEHLMEPSG